MMPQHLPPEEGNTGVKITIWRCQIVAIIWGLEFDENKKGDTIRFGVYQAMPIS